MVETWEYQSIPRVVFGVDSRKRIGEEARHLTSGRRCIVVTDRGVRGASLVDALNQSLEEEGFNVTVFDRVKAEPALESFDEGLAFAREKNPDVIVGVGGGSSLDVAKVLSHALTISEPLEHFLGKDLPGAGIPLITVPTTSGTGAEVTPDAVVLLPDERVKSCFLNVRANVAVVDPKMTVTLPPRLTAATGIDALSHAIESMLSILATPVTLAMASKAIELVSRSLRTAIKDGDNLEARADMSLAALMAGFSEGNAGDVEAHAIGQLIGPFYGLHHGEACGIGLPCCMRMHLECDQARLVTIGKALEGTRGSMAKGGGISKRAINEVYDLIRGVGLPTGLDTISQAKKDDVSQLAEIYCTHPEIVEFFELSRCGKPSIADAERMFEELFALEVDLS